MCLAQLKASGESACQNRRLRLESSALAQIFIASTAELPGLLLAAMVMDIIGRKWCAAQINYLCLTVAPPAAGGDVHGGAAEGFAPILSCSRASMRSRRNVSKELSARQVTGGWAAADWTCLA